MGPRVSIVIVSMNGESELRKCLDSLKKLDYTDYDITIVDNASVDGTCDMLRSEYPDVQLIPLDRNSGRSEGLNIGTFATGGKYVLHLDNDVTVTDQRWLSLLVEAMENDETIGACGSIIMDEGRDTIQSAGASFDAQYITSSYQPWTGRTDYESLPGPIESDYICGCAVLFRRSAMDQVGHYDIRYFMYWDDVDICISMKRLGMKVITLTTTSIRHRVGTSAGARSVFAYYHCAKGRMIMMRKYGKLSHWPGFLLRLILQPWPGDSKRRRLKYWRMIYPATLRAIGWNIRDSIAAGRHPSQQGAK